MTWCCDSTRGTLWFRGLILVPYPLPASRSVLMSHSIAGCASMARSTFPTSARRTISQRWVPVGNFRTFLAVPLRQQGELVGALFARRTEVRPFTPAQIKLLETFADQAVIAIENVRLFQELKESWSSRPRRVKSWASSPARRRTSSRFLNVVAESAARLCDAMMRRYFASKAIFFGWSRITDRCPCSQQLRPIIEAQLMGRAVLDRQTIHVHDLRAEIETEFPGRQVQQAGTRTMLATPLLREGVPIGVI